MFASLKAMLLFVILLLFVVVQVVVGCDLYDTDTAVCAEDLDSICGMNSFPETIQALYDSRNCLRKNRDQVSTACLNYLELEKPSIVDSCFTEMKSYCFNIAPGGFRVHSCLSAVPVKDLSPSCKVAIKYDEKIIQEKGAMFSAAAIASPSVADMFPAAFWMPWLAYLSQISHDFTETHRQFLTLYYVQRSMPTNFLRGSMFSLQEENEEDEEEQVYAISIGSDDNDDDDSSTNDFKETADASQKVEETEADETEENEFSTTQRANSNEVKNTELKELHWNHPKLQQN